MKPKSESPGSQDALNIKKGEVFVGEDQPKGVTYNINSVSGGIVAHTLINQTISTVPLRSPEELIELLKAPFMRKNRCEYYVPLDGSSTPLSVDKEKQKEQRKSLHDSHVFPFLTDQSRRFLLLLGDSGAGKSTYAHKLVEICWEDFRNKKVINRIPILLECKSLLDKTLTKLSLIQDIMRNYGLTELEVCSLKDLPLLVIFDGYDEKQVQDVNICELFELEKWNAKILTTCRIQYIQENRNYKILFPSSIHSSDSELYVYPFSSAQVDMCILKYTQGDAFISAGDWNVNRNDYPELYELIENPLLLNMVVEALPNILKKHEEIKKRFDQKHDRVMHLPKFTRADIYRAFIESWHERAARRLLAITGQSVVKLWDYPSKFPTQDAFGVFCENLSLSMYTASESADHVLSEVEYQLPSSVTRRRTKIHNESNPWVKFFTTEDEVITGIRQGCPLRYSNNKYAFYHKSFSEYYMALSIFNELLDEESLGDSTEEILSRLVNHPINKKLIVKDRAVLEFLAQMIQGDARRIEMLLIVVRASRESSLGLSVTVAAANAITTLNACYFNLSGLDFSGVNIAYADLRGAYCDRTNFEGANLTGVNFAYAWLREAKIINCILKDVSFGEYSRYFHSEREFKCFAYCEDRYFAWLDEKNINIYDYFSGHLLSSLFLGKNTDGIKCMQFNSEGTLLLYVYENLIYILDVVTGEDFAILAGHEKDVNAAVFSPDGTKIVSGSDDMTVRIWDVYNKCELSVFEGHKGGVLCCSFSHDGLLVVSAGKDMKALIWDVLSEKNIGILTGHRAEVTCVKFSPDRKQIVSGSEDKTLRIWDLESFVQQMVLIGHTWFISDAVFSANSEWVVSSSLDNTVRVWEVVSGKELTTLYGRDSQTSVHISRDGRRITSSEPSRNTVHSWGELMSRMGDPLEVEKNRINKVTFFQSGEQFVSGDYDSLVKVWDAKKNRVTTEFNTHQGYIESLAISKNGNLIATGGSDCSIRVFDLSTKGEIAVLYGHTQKVNCLQFGSDENILLSGSDDTTVRIWDLKKKASIKLLKGHERAVSCITFSPDEKQVVSGGADQSVRFWDLDTSRMIAIINHSGETPANLYFSQHGNFLLANRWILDANIFKKNYFRGEMYNGQITAFGKLEKQYGGLLYESPREERRHTLDIPSDTEQVMFSEDNEHVLVVGKNMVEVWNVSTNEKIAQMPLNFHKQISRFSYSHHLLVLVLKDGGLQCWDKLDDYRWCLRWSTDFVNQGLYVQGLVTENLRDLSETNHQLLYQRGAKISEPVPALSIEDVPGLRVFLKNPVLVKLAMESLSELVEFCQIMPGKLSKSGVFDLIINRLFLDLEKKFELTNSVMQSEDFESEFWKLAKCLAKYMHQKNLTEVCSDGNLSRLTGTSEAKLSVLLSSCIFQEIRSKCFRFVYPGLLRYFLTRDFYDVMRIRSQTDKDDYFNQCFFVDDDEIVLYLVDRVGLSHQFQSNLLGCLYSSKNNPETAIAAANAITILVKAEVKFNGANLTGIHIPCANISAGHFIGADLSRSILTNVKMRNVLLTHAKLDDCQMPGVDFFESPRFEHEDEVVCFDYREDLCRLVSASKTKCFIWDTVSGECLFELIGHEASVTCVRFSPNGKEIVTGSADTTLRIWNVHSGEEVALLIGHEAAISCLQYSPDSLRLVSGGVDKAVRVWHVKTAKEILAWKEFDYKIESVDFSPDGTEIIISDQNIWACKLLTGELNKFYMQDVRSEDNKRLNIKFKIQGNKLGSGGNDKILLIWNKLSDEVLTEMAALPGKLSSVSFIAEGNYFVSECLDQSIQFWEVNADKGLALIKDHEQKINCFQCFSTEQRVVLGRGNTIILKKISDAPLTLPIKNYASKISKLAFSVDAKILASGSVDGSVRTWDAENGKEIAVQHKHTKEVDKLMFSADGRRLLSGSIEVVCVWDAGVDGGFTLVKDLSLSTICLSISPKSNYIAYCDPFGEAEAFIVMELNSEQNIGVLKRLPTDDYLFWYPLNPLFSPDESFILMDKLDAIKRWNFKNDNLPIDIMKVDGGLHCFEFSSDGSSLLCSESELILIVHSELGTHIAMLAGHTDTVKKASFCNNEKWVISGSDDGTIRVWDISRGECLSVFSLDSNVANFAFSNSGQITLAYQDGNLESWQYLSVAGENKWQMLWSHCRVLNVKGLHALNVKGLSNLNYRLLKQRGANITVSESSENVDRAHFSPKLVSHSEIVEFKKDKGVLDFAKSSNSECLYNVEAIACAHRGVILASRSDPPDDKECEDALVEFDTSIFLDPTCSWVFRERGHCKKSLFRKHEAIDDLNEAIRLNPKDYAAFMLRGDCKFALRGFDDAEQDYDEVIRLNPYYKDAVKHRDTQKYFANHYCNMSNKHLDMGIEKAEKGFHTGAIPDYNEAIRYNCNNTEAIRMRGRCKSDLGQYHDALVDYDEAIRLNPNFARAFRNRGITLLYLGELESAMRDFCKAIECTDLSSDPYAMLMSLSDKAFLFMIQNLHEESADMMACARVLADTIEDKMDSSFILAINMCNLVELFLDYNSDKDAEVIFDKFNALFQEQTKYTEIEFIILMGLGFFHLGNYLKAYVCWNDILGITPEKGSELEKQLEFTMTCLKEGSTDSLLGNELSVKKASFRFFPEVLTPPAMIEEQKRIQQTYQALLDQKKLPVHTIEDDLDEFISSEELNSEEKNGQLLAETEDDSSEKGLNN